MDKYVLLFLKQMKGTLLGYEDVLFNLELGDNGSTRQNISDSIENLRGAINHLEDRVRGVKNV